MPGDFRLGPWLLEPSRNSITRDGKTIRLEPRVVEVVCYLAQHPGETVSKEQLIQAVWGGTFVTDDVLTRSISELRKALEDDPKAPRAIETIPKRGYRLLLEVEPQSHRELAASIAPESRLRKWVPVAILLVVAVITALALLPANVRNRLYSRKSAPVIEAIAVLPLENLSGNPEQAYLADGMTEALINDLARTGTVTVIARNSIMRYQGSKRPLPEIARELHVDAIITGSVVRSGSRVRVTTQLIDARSEHSLWADSYESEMRDIISIQDEFARAVVRQVNGKLSPEQQQRLARVSAKVDPEAYELYIKGRYHFNRRGHPGEIEKARTYFEQSLNEDATYAPPYSGLADVFLRLAFEGTPREEALALAKAAALKALELDESLAEAHVSLANLKENELDWAGADQEYRRAIELNPNYAHAHHWYSQMLSELGRHDEAIAEIRRAYELDPLSPLTWTPGDALYMARRYDEAIAYARRMLELDPNEPAAYRILLFAYKAKGDLDRHMEAWSKYVLLTKFETPDTVAKTLQLYARGGIKATARALLPKAMKENWEADDLAKIHVSLGQHEQAIRYLEMEIKQGGGYWLKVEPWWDPLRAEPGFQALLRRMNFPDT